MTTALGPAGTAASATRARPPCPLAAVTDSRSSQDRRRRQSPAGSAALATSCHDLVEMAKEIFPVLDVT